MNACGRTLGVGVLGVVLAAVTVTGCDQRRGPWVAPPPTAEDLKSVALMQAIVQAIPKVADTAPGGRYATMQELVAATPPLTEEEFVALELAVRSLPTEDEKLPDAESMSLGALVPHVAPLRQAARAALADAWRHREDEDRFARRIRVCFGFVAMGERLDLPVEKAGALSGLELVAMLAKEANASQREVLAREFRAAFGDDACTRADALQLSVGVRKEVARNARLIEEDARSFLHYSNMEKFDVSKRRMVTELRECAAYLETVDQDLIGRQAVIGPWLTKVESESVARLVPPLDSLLRRQAAAVKAICGGGVADAAADVVEKSVERESDGSGR